MISPSTIKGVVAAGAREAISAALSKEQPDLGEDLEQSRLSFQLECLQSALEHLNENHNLRLSYTGRIYWLVVAWLACVVLCITATGLGWANFKLSDTVIIAFITSTTVNVVGLFVLVAKWMYPASLPHDSAEALQTKADGIKKVQAAKKKSPKPSLEI